MIYNFRDQLQELGHFLGKSTELELIFKTFSWTFESTMTCYFQVVHPFLTPF